MNWKLTLAWVGLMAKSTLAQSPVIPATPAISEVPSVVVPADQAPITTGYFDGALTNGPTTLPKRGVLASNPFDSANHILPNDGPFRTYGWLNGGVMGNASNPASRFNGPYNAIDRNDLMFNQAYLITERVLTNDEGIDFGFRADLLYGFDYFLAQSRGFEVRPDGSPKWNSNQYYGLALPQLFTEFGNTNASVKVGRFYSVVGYEGVPSAGNFFYSHSYSYQFAGPFTHWGALGTIKRGNWTFDAGIVNGWNALDQESDHANFLGRARWADDENFLGVSFAIITGNEETLTTSRQSRNRTRYSFIVDVNPTSNLEYVFHHWLGLQDDGDFVSVGRSSTGPSTGGTALWYGIDQYLYYRINDKLKVGSRFEWFRDEDGTRVGLNRPANPNGRPLAGNFFSMTYGLNYSPLRNIMIRPELRYDTQGAGFPAFNDGFSKNMFTYGVDLVIAF